MNEASKLAQWLHDKIPQAFLQITDWKKIQKLVQKLEETGFDYYDRFEKVFKQHFSIDEVNDDTSVLFNSAFVKGL